MARIRTVKPEFWTDETMAEVPREVRLLFLGLLNHVDDEGRCVDNPRLVKAAVFPLDDDITSEIIRRWLDELSTKARVVLYEASGRRYLQVCNFRKHQKIDRPAPSRLPDPKDCNIVHVTPGQSDFVEPSTNAQRGVDEASLHDQGSGISIRDLDQGSLLPVEPSPNAVVVESKAVAVAPARRTDEAFEALCRVTATNPAELTTAARGAMNRALAEIRGVYRGDDLAAEILTRAGRYITQMGEARITPSALAKHWGSLTVESERLQSSQQRKNVTTVADESTLAIASKWAR